MIISVCGVVPDWVDSFLPKRRRCAAAQLLTLTLTVCITQRRPGVPRKEWDYMSEWHFISEYTFRRVFSTRISLFLWVLALSMKLHTCSLDRLYITLQAFIIHCPSTSCFFFNFVCFSSFSYKPVQGFFFPCHVSPWNMKGGVWMTNTCEV